MTEFLLHLAWTTLIIPLVTKTSMIVRDREATGMEVMEATQDIEMFERPEADVIARFMIDTALLVRTAAALPVDPRAIMTALV